MAFDSPQIVQNQLRKGFCAKLNTVLFICLHENVYDKKHIDRKFEFIFYYLTLILQRQHFWHLQIDREEPPAIIIQMLCTYKVCILYVNCILLNIRYKVCTVNRIPMWY